MKIEIGDHDCTLPNLNKYPEEFVEALRSYDDPTTSVGHLAVWTCPECKSDWTGMRHRNDPKSKRAYGIIWRRATNSSIRWRRKEAKRLQQILQTGESV